MAIFFNKLAKSTSASFNTAFVGKPKSGSAVFSFSAITAMAGGFSTYYHISESESNLLTLKSDKWLEFKLQDTARASHNSHLFRFSFDPSAKLGLEVAACILTRHVLFLQTGPKVLILNPYGFAFKRMAPLGQNAEGKTKYVIRPYTPISDPDAMGHFDLLIKIWGNKCLRLHLFVLVSVHTSKDVLVYPEGKMSQIFATLKPGDVLEVKGPIEKLRYSPNMKKHIGMVRADDILLKQKLDILEAGHPNLKVFYTVDNPTKKWKGGTRYTSKDMVTKGLPGPSDDTLIFVCGPPGMMEHICGGKAKDHSQGQLTGILKELGYTEQMVYQF
ncbi:hypothetical protein Gohar_007944 [Gossypium harknessii]|uniref:cytochrome-b5 reductase n=1 Tax=Gossypium harknessii TaxID=34285 RepID=A0A7J9GI38_9ROSI|nr:hypothetical protein [Gossypium harknessii]